ncbi:MAG: hypothetical protein ACP5XB_04295, partial [Isosphaeraceae bacterium]
IPHSIVIGSRLVFLSQLQPLIMGCSHIDGLQLQRQFVFKQLNAVKQRASQQEVPRASPRSAPAIPGPLQTLGYVETSVVFGEECQNHRR